jgi:hypothetical protein
MDDMASAAAPMMNIKVLDAVGKPTFEKGLRSWSQEGAPSVTRQMV